MSSSGNFLITTADQPYLSVDGLTGVGFKPMNTLDDQRISSVVIRVETGQTLPARRNTALCEYLVVQGVGHYANGQTFAAGDYLREEVGDYALINAQEELVLFLTNHGDCSYIEPNGSTGFVVGVESIKEMKRQ